MTRENTVLEVWPQKTLLLVVAFKPVSNTQRIGEAQIAPGSNRDEDK